MLPVLAETTASGLENVGTGITFLLEQTKTILDLVISSPILALGIAAWCVFAAVSLFKRLV